MPKNKLFSILLIISLLSLGLGIGAQSNNLEQIPDRPIFGEGGVLDTIATYLLRILIFAAAICFVVAGFYFVTAAGDPAKFQTAKMMVIYGLIGLLIGFSAWALVNLVKTIFAPGTPIQNPQLPPSGVI